MINIISMNIRKAYHRIIIPLLYGLLVVSPKSHGQLDQTINIAAGGYVMAWDNPLTCNYNNIFFSPPPWVFNDISYSMEGECFVLFSLRLLKADMVTQTINAYPPIGNYGFSAMVTDRKGRLLIAGTEKFGIVNHQNGAFTEIGEFPPGSFARGDLTWYKGRLLMTALSGNAGSELYLYEVPPEDPAGMTFLALLSHPASPALTAEAMVTIMDRCDNQRVFILGAATGGLYNAFEIDMTDYSLIPVCKSNIVPSGGAMLYDYITASCDLIVKLDWDNSSGVVGFGWRDTIACRPVSHPVCDEDVYVYAEARIDSMIIWLEGNIPDGSEEMLSFSGYPGISVVGQTPQRMMLVNIGDISFPDWEAALRAIRYSHSGVQPTPGWRSVAFLPYAPIRDADTIRAELYVAGGWPIAGADTIVRGCYGSTSVGLTSILSSDAQTGGFFSPNMSDWQPSPMIDTTIVYYIVSHPECSSDTAMLTLVSLPTPMAELGSDQFACYGDTVWLTPMETHSILWEDGSQTWPRAIIQSGTYIVTVTNEEGCSSADMVDINISVAPLIIDEGIHRMCPGDSLIWIGQTLLMEGLYYDIQEDGNACDSVIHQVEIRYDSYPSAEVIGDTLICYGDVGMLAVVGGEQFVWNTGQSSSSITVVQSGLYQVTVSSMGSLCTLIFNKNVVVTLPIEEPIVTLTHPDCNSPTDGSLIISQPVGGHGQVTMFLDGLIISPDVRYPIPAGQYSLEIRDVAGCMMSIPILIESGGTTGELAIPDYLTAVAGTELLIHIIQGVTGGVYVWTPADIIEETFPGGVSVKPHATGWVWVEAIDAAGCMYRDSVWVQLTAPVELYLPTAFSPNGDGINDIFSVYGNDQVRAIHLFAVYDRWGNELYRQSLLPINDPITGWDGYFKGKLMDPGMYVYVMKLEFMDGSIRMYKGDVLLVR